MNHGSDGVPLSLFVGATTMLGVNGQACVRVRDASAAPADIVEHRAIIPPDAL